MNQWSCGDRGDESRDLSRLQHTCNCQLHCYIGVSSQVELKTYMDVLVNSLWENTCTYWQLLVILYQK
jgi:hypothetical protein